jgi:hypothetical protein
MRGATVRISILALSLITAFAIGHSIPTAPLEAPSDQDRHVGMTGMLAPGRPIQDSLVSGGYPLERDGWTLFPVATFQVDGLVLGRRRYRFDDLSPMSPIDLALGWGVLSDPEIARRLEVSQARRFYHWRFGPKDGLDIREVSLNSANMHMIPFDDEVRQALLEVRAGNVVSISVILVDVSDPHDRQWRTSRSRGDVGAGACEIILVMSVRRFEDGSP